MEKIGHIQGRVLERRQSSHGMDWVTGLVGDWQYPYGNAVMICVIFDRFQLMLNENYFIGNTIGWSSCGTEQVRGGCSTKTAVRTYYQHRFIGPKKLDFFRAQQLGCRKKNEFKNNGY